MKAREVRSIHIMRTKLIYKAANVYSFGYHSAQVITRRSQLAASAPRLGAIIPGAGGLGAAPCVAVPGLTLPRWG